MNHNMKCPECYEISTTKEIEAEEPSGIESVWYHCPRCGKWSVAEEWVVYDDGLIGAIIRKLAFRRLQRMEKAIPYESPEQVNAYFEKEKEEYNEWWQKEVKKTPADMFREWGL